MVKALLDRSVQGERAFHVAGDGVAELGRRNPRRG
jgi:hypothetical protein